MTPLLFSCTPNPLGYRRYEFRYSFGMNEDFGDEVYYSDSLFFAPASEYNPTLSTVSLALAMAA